MDCFRPPRSTGPHNTHWQGEVRGLTPWPWLGFFCSLYPILHPNQDTLLCWGCEDLAANSFKGVNFLSVFLSEIKLKLRDRGFDTDKSTNTATVSDTLPGLSLCHSWWKCLPDNPHVLGCCQAGHKARRRRLWHLCSPACLTVGKGAQLNIFHNIYKINRIRRRRATAIFFKVFFYKKNYIARLFLIWKLLWQQN